MPHPDDHAYVDLAGWLSLGNATHLRRLIRDHDVQSVLEIGSFCGLSTLLFAMYVPHVTTIDTFAGSDEAYLKHPTVMAKLGRA